MRRLGSGMLPLKSSLLPLILFDVFLILCKVGLETAVDDFANFINLNNSKKKTKKKKMMV